MMQRMLTDVWPLFGLTITTARLELRVPRDEEIAELACLAGRGVHKAAERPFLTPWTEGEPRDRELSVLQGHWGCLSSWDSKEWTLGLGVFYGGTPLGRVTLRARDFAVVREVTTSSWLGVEHHGKGYGTEARAGLLTLAFDHLDAEHAVTEVFQDNHASQGVSRKLGYVPDGISRDARGDEALVSDRLRLTRHAWSQLQDRPSAEVKGLDACREMFGA
jgi:RimJ/RimL family protein N-acetyltransferase